MFVPIWYLEGYPCENKYIIPEDNMIYGNVAMHFVDNWAMQSILLEGVWVVFKGYYYP